ncbi:hypothetical protein P4O66_009804 [Electrophorus voltai]|uniref:Uncharacterized protein n=1 Tax=Electrophorus voltai TaxID=2609070 RepID=A0AAD8ZEW9_9TELE|nr:hypothetical protein P4O66_009804 [Electrophorus voltai]
MSRLPLGRLQLREALVMGFLHPKLLYNALHGPKLLYNTLHGPKLLYNALHGPKLLYNVLHGPKLLYNALHGPKLLYNALHRPKLLYNTLHGPKLLYNTLHGPKLVYNTLHGPKLLYNTLHGPKPLYNTLHGPKLLYNTLHGETATIICRLKYLHAPPIASSIPSSVIHKTAGPIEMGFKEKGSVGLEGQPVGQPEPPEPSCSVPGSAAQNGNSLARAGSCQAHTPLIYQEGRSRRCLPLLGAHRLYGRAPLTTPIVQSGPWQSSGNFSFAL